MPIAEPAPVNELESLPTFDESLPSSSMCELFFRSGNIAEFKILKAIMTAGEAAERLAASPHQYSASGIFGPPLAPPPPQRIEIVDRAGRVLEPHRK